jgi:hypothetical protein
MRRVLVVLAAVVVVLGLASCGGGSSSSTGPTNSDTTAMLLVRQTDVGLIGLSASGEHLLRLEIPMEFSNGRTVPCNLNYVRLQLFANSVEIERAEVTADDIVSLGGTNRVIQGAPVAVTLVFDFNSLEFDRVALIANGLDDRGQEHNRWIESLNVEVAPELQAASSGAR